MGFPPLAVAGASGRGPWLLPIHRGSQAGWEGQPWAAPQGLGNRDVKEKIREELGEKENFPFMLCVGSLPWIVLMPSRAFPLFQEQGSCFLLFLAVWGYAGVLLGGCRGTVVDSVVLCGQADALLSDLPSEAQIAKPAPQNLSEMHILPSQPRLTELEILGLEPPPPCPHPEQSLLQQSRQ